MGGQLKVGMVMEITVKTEKEHTATYFYEKFPNVFNSRLAKMTVK